MKRAVILLLTALILFTACGSSVNFNVQYIRADISWREDYFIEYEAVVTSRDELEQYSADMWHDYVPDVFSEAVEKYTDEFFKTGYLFIFYRAEGSGSVKHKVTKISEDGEITIERTSPQEQTADIAEWHIVIELGNDFKPGEFNVKFTGIN